MAEDARRCFREELRRLVITRAGLIRQSAWDSAASGVRQRQAEIAPFKVMLIKHNTVQGWLDGSHLPRTWEALHNVVRVAEGHARNHALSKPALDLLSEEWRPRYKRAWAEQEAEARRNAHTSHSQSFVRPNYVVKRFAAPVRPPIEKLRDEAPSQLLAARNVVVGFTGRRHEREALAEWRDGRSAGGRAVRLLWGDGGQGKTRLATEWAADSAKGGWEVLLAELDKGIGEDLSHFEPDGKSHGRLLLVDYAERWPRADLEQLLKSDPVVLTGSVRVLLLARAAGPWWDALRPALKESGYRCDTMKLEALADALADRQVVFDRAVNGFAEVLGLADTAGLSAAGSLDDDDYQLALAVHMAALVAVDARMANRRSPRSPGALSEYLLDREQRHWQLMRDAEWVTMTTRDMGRVVSMATFTRPMRWEAAEDLLGRVGLCGKDQPEDGRRMLDDHASCYPPAEPEYVLEPLFPDLLGEDFLARKLLGLNSEVRGAKGDHPRDGWCKRLPRRLLTPAEPPGSPEYTSGDQDLPEPDRAVPPYRRSAWTMLIETSRRWPDVAKRHLYPLLKELLEEQPDVISDIGSAALSRLPDDTPLDVLESLEKAFPEHGQVDLDAGIAGIAARLTQYRLDATDNRARKAELHLDLARRWGAAGLYDRALHEVEQAVQIYRWLIQEMGEEAAEAPLLGAALMTLGSILAQLQRLEEAHTAAEEAVQIFRRLVRVNRVAVEPFLAQALTRLSEAQLNLRRYEETRTSAEEAVKVLRHLAREDWDKWAGSLSGGLMNLAMACAKLGQSEKAAAAGKEAIDNTRLLTLSEPAMYEPILAMALNNFGLLLLDLWLIEEASVFTEEAVQILRRLALVNPVAFEPQLFGPLSNLCNLLSKLERHEEALAYADEAAQIVRKLAQENRARAEPGLASVLTNRGSSLWHLRRRAEAKAAIEEAIEIYRRLAAENPDTFNPDLASALETLGGVLSDLCLIEEARVAAEEAIEICRPLARDHPAKYESTLAGALVALSWVLSDLWLIKSARVAAEAARAAAEEASRIFRKKARANSDVFEPFLVTALFVLSAAYMELGRYEEAKTTADEAVQIARKLVQENPAKNESRNEYEFWLAMALTCQRLARANPDDPDLALAQAFLVHISLLPAAEDISIMAEAEEMMRLLMPPDRHAPFGRAYINGLKMLADTFDILGEYDQADSIRRQIAGPTTK